MRDEWKRMLKSRHNSCGFTNENVPEFVAALTRCCRSSRTNPIQSLVELLLASINEIMMYFYIENIDINFNYLISLISMDIVGATGLNRNDSEKLEGLFDSFDDISEYTGWITDFITRNAIPYGSRHDVSNLFFEGLKEQFYLKKVTYLIKLKDSFRFLPPDLFEAVTDGRSGKGAKSILIKNESQPPETPTLHITLETGALGKVISIGNLSTHSENASERLSQSQQSRKSEERITAEGTENLPKSISIPSNSEELKPQKLPMGSEIGAVGGKQSLGRLSTCTKKNVSEQFAGNKLNTEISLEVGIEQDLEKMGLDAEGTSHVKSIVRRQSKKDIGKKKAS